MFVSLTHLLHYRTESQADLQAKRSYMPEQRYIYMHGFLVSFDGSEDASASLFT